MNRVSLNADSGKQAPSNQKEYSIIKEGFSLFGSILLSWVLCTIMFLFTVSIAEYAFAQVLYIIIMNLLMFVFLYAKMWDRGDKDNNMVTFGHIKYDRWRGLKIGAVAAIPYLFVNLLLVFFKLTNIFPGYLTIYKIIHIFNIYLINYMTNSAESLDLTSWSTILIICSFVLAIPLFSTLTYWLGYKRISIGERVVYVNGKKQKVKKSPKTKKSTIV